MVVLAAQPLFGTKTCPIKAPEKGPQPGSAAALRPPCRSAASVWQGREAQGEAALPAAGRSQTAGRAVRLGGVGAGCVEMCGCGGREEVEAGGRQLAVHFFVEAPTS